MQNLHPVQSEEQFTFSQFSPCPLPQTTFVPTSHDPRGSVVHSVSFNQLRQRQPAAKKRKQLYPVSTLIPSSARASGEPNRIPTGIDPNLGYELHRSPPLSRSPVASIPSSRELYQSLLTCPSVLSAIPTESYRTLSPLYQPADLSSLQAPYAAYQNPYSPGVPVSFAPAASIQQAISFQAPLGYDIAAKESMQDRRSVLYDPSGRTPVANLEEVKTVPADIVACLRMDSSDHVPDPTNDIPMMETVKSEVKVVDRE